MMGSFRRPRPRFMSSPVLSDLARFHANSSVLQLSNATVWNSVQSAVIKVFEGGALQNNELYTLNESIRWLLKTEMGSFITEYFQKQLLTRALSDVLDQILLSAEDRLLVLSEAWDRFFTETLPTLQAIFYPVQGQELSVRQMSLLAFRDLVLLKLHLEKTLRTAASVPPPVTHMLLVLQGVHEWGGVSVEYDQLEHLVEAVVHPYVNNNKQQLISESRPLRSGWLLGDQPQITVTQHSCSDSSSLAPQVEQEGGAYLERAGAARRHTVANAASDARLLSLGGRRRVGEGAGPLSATPFSSQPDMGEPRRGGVR